MRNSLSQVGSVHHSSDNFLTELPQLPIDDDYRMNIYHTHLDDVNMSIFGLRFAKKGLCDVRGVDAVSEEFQVMFRK